MKPVLARTAAAVMVAVGAAIGFGGDKRVAAEEILIIGSSSVGGSYYLYAGGLSSYITENSDLIRLTAQTTRGSVENVRLLAADRLDFGLSNAAVVHGHRAGTGQFEGQASDQIRGVAILDIAPSHWVTEANSGVESIRDLEGKRVSIGAPGSGTANTAMVILDAAGIRDSVDIVNFGFSESADSMRDGHLEAFAASSAIPMPAVVDLATTRSLRLLSLDDDLVAAVQAEIPAYDAVVIPAGTYQGLDEDVQTVGVPSTIVTRASLDEELVYEMVRLMFEDASRSFMRDIYSAWDPQNGASLFERIEVPLHPGAERYYREQGWIQ